MILFIYLFQFSILFLKDAFLFIILFFSNIRKPKLENPRCNQNPTYNILHVNSKSRLIGISNHSKRKKKKKVYFDFFFYLFLSIFIFIFVKTFSFIYYHYYYFNFTPSFSSFPPSSIIAWYVMVFCLFHFDRYIYIYIFLKLFKLMGFIRVTLTYQKSCSPSLTWFLWIYCLYSLFI